MTRGGVVGAIHARGPATVVLRSVMGSFGLSPVTAVASGGGSLSVGDKRIVSVMLIPNGSATGTVVISGSIDGGTTYATLLSQAVTASTNVLVHFVDLPLTHVNINTAGVSAGAVTSQISGSTGG